MFFYYPDENCSNCSRLVCFREENIRKFSDKFNKPVPSFGDKNPELLIVGLAPGLKGANFTGRPFTGDYAGDMLYKSLLDFGFARGVYEKKANDSIKLINCRITNAVRCVPPKNNPTGGEVKNCLYFLRQEIAELKNLKLLIAIGRTAHEAILKSYEIKLSQFKFQHGAVHKIKDDISLIDSYHCSRYNINTGRLNQEMFNDIFKIIKKML